MKILLVEDNAKIRRLIRKTLSGQVPGVLDIYECEDGQEAMELYAAIHPDWVIMDIKLKKVDGLTATQKIRDADPAARVIILTQYEDALYREAAQKAGARDYILKENLLELPERIGGSGF